MDYQKKFCPRCDSEDVDMAAGGITGGWMCRDCGYSGIFPEKPLILEEENVNTKKSKKNINKRVRK